MPVYPSRRFRDPRAAMWDAATLRPHVEISLKVFQNSVQGNADPVRPALKLIFHFEQPFLQNISVQQDFYLCLRMWQTLRWSGGLKVASQKESTHPLVPGFGPTLQPGGSIRVRDDARDMIKENSMRDVMKRADHAGNILNGRPFDAPLAHGSRVLSIKVGNDVIVSGIKHIGEVKVAMVSSTHTGDPGVTESRETFAQYILLFQDCPGFFLC